MSEHYEVSFCNEVRAFDTIEGAIEFADESGADMISQIGGNYTDFEKCSFCGEWFDCCELYGGGICRYCDQAIKSHGG